MVQTASPYTRVHEVPCPTLEAGSDLQKTLRGDICELSLETGTLLAVTVTLRAVGLHCLPR
jgi:hypothetical protein